MFEHFQIVFEIEDLLCAFIAALVLLHPLQHTHQALERTRIKIRTYLDPPKRRTREEVQQLVAEFVSSGMRPLIAALVLCDPHPVLPKLNHAGIDASLDHGACFQWHRVEVGSHLGTSRLIDAREADFG